MNPLAVILLSFLVGCALMSTLMPIPFLSFAVNLLGFPLALAISMKDLVLVQLVHTVFSFALRFDWLFFNYQMGWSVVQDYGFAEFAWVQMFYQFGYWIIMAIMGVAVSVGLAVLMKALSHFTPRIMKDAMRGIP